jgi:hypothetical protein
VKVDLNIDKLLGDGEEGECVRIVPCKR